MQRIRAACDSCAGNHDELQMTLNTLKLYHPDSQPCQRCGKQIWFSRKTASYRRGITYVWEGKRIDGECTIPVFLCPECGKSDRPGGSPITVDLATAYITCSLGSCRGLGKKFFALLKDHF